LLIVDDDASLVARIRAELADYDLIVDAADDAETAAALLDRESYCGMVLDLVLATGSGFDVLHHLAATRLHVPTVVVTSKLPSYVREMLNADDVKLVFPKPVDPHLLATVVLGLCGISTR
jgi:DNA-binding response OmpR family regulator